MRKVEDVILKDGRNLKEVLESHKKWLEGEEGGRRADLSWEDLLEVDLKDIDLRYVFLRGANLSYANLKGTNLIGVYLSDANLKGANLEGVYLSYANLEGANLSDAYLKDVNLSDANLEGANLSGANLSGANLKGADLRVTNLIGINLIDANLKRADLRGANLTDASLTGANLKDVKDNHITSFFELQCPEKGSFIGYKKANNKIVELLITEDAKRSSATTRKCRCNKAKVLSITSLDGKKNFKKVVSDYDSNFIYEVGKIVEVKNFDENRWKKCAHGIHFFITRNEAVMY